MKKRIFGIFVVLFLMFSGGMQGVRAEESCDKQAAIQLAKILSKEVGANGAKNDSENFFSKLTTAGVVLNNAYYHGKSSASLYENLYNLTNNQYQGYSSYKDKSFEDVVDSSLRGEMLYIAEVVITGKYTLPKNMVLQADESIVKKNGTVWTYVEYKSPYGDVYFGYPLGSSLSDVDVFGNKLSNTSVEYYKSKANSLKLSDYSAYTTSTVCSGLSGSGSTGSGTEGQGDNDTSSINFAVDVCTNPDILKVICFILILIDFVKFVVPVGLIIMGMMDFAKSVMANDENAQKKNVNLFIKRIIYAVALFLVPTIVKFSIEILGDLASDINFTDCIQNANIEKIKELEEQAASEEENTSNNNSGNISNNGTNSYDYIIYVGDSRTVGMCDSVDLNDNEDCSIAEGSKGYTWLNSDEIKNKIKSAINKHPNSYLVISMGTNSKLTANEAKQYAELYNDFAKEYSNSKVVAVSVPQIDFKLAQTKGMFNSGTYTSDDVRNFNSNLKSNLSSDVMYCDIYSKLNNYSYKSYDGVHFYPETYKFIYSEINNCLG